MEQIKTAKIFKNGGSRAVRLPKDFCIGEDEVLLTRRGNQVILQPKGKKKSKKSSWEEFFFNTPLASPDFMEGIEDLPPQERDFF